MRFTDLFIRRPVLASVVSLLILLIGLRSIDLLQVRQGSLYPALHRLEHRGWIRSRWGTSENNRRAKYYEITRAGERRLERETRDWERLTVAVARVLEAGST